MTYVITETCVAVCDTACVQVCPVDCIHGPLPLPTILALAPAQRPQMFIDPGSCIECGMCEAACPVGAIFHERDVPSHHASATTRNAEFFQPAPSP